MISTTSFIAFIAFLAVGLCVPAKRPTSIKGQLIDPSIGEFISEDQLGTILRQSFTPSKSQAAGIAKSRIGYMKASRAASEFDIPAVSGIRFTAKLSGSVKFNGLIARVVESQIDESARSYSTDFYSFYQNEKKSMQARAGARFFWFFQAAANYGYSDNKVTRETVSNGDFQNFSNRTNSLLKNIDAQQLEARYDVTYEGTSTGRKDRVKALAYILINQIELDSGRILNIIKQSPELVVADEDDKQVIDPKPDGDVEVTTLNELTVETELERTLI